MNTTARLWADLGERAGWTLLQAGFGLALIDQLNLPAPWAAVAATTLAVVKGLLASRFGTGSAATVPITLERY